MEQSTISRDDEQDIKINMVIKSIDSEIKATNARFHDVAVNHVEAIYQLSDEQLETEININRLQTKIEKQATMITILGWTSFIALVLAFVSYLHIFIG
ncbi:hypothetical protein N2E09_00385 [Leuconostoc citreum]